MGLTASASTRPHPRWRSKPAGARLHSPGHDALPSAPFATRSSPSSRYSWPPFSHRCCRCPGMVVARRRVEEQQSTQRAVEQVTLRLRILPRVSRALAAPLTAATSCSARPNLWTSFAGACLSSPCIHVHPPCHSQSDLHSIFSSFCSLPPASLLQHSTKVPRQPRPQLRFRSSTVQHVVPG